MVPLDPKTVHPYALIYNLQSRSVQGVDLLQVRHDHSQEAVPQEV